jgi:hypothetical protein
MLAIRPKFGNAARIPRVRKKISSRWQIILRSLPFRELGFASSQQHHNRILNVLIWLDWLWELSFLYAPMLSKTNTGGEAAIERETF